MIKTYDLSILIPARNEEWLPQTVEDMLKNKRGNTEILVGLDGYWCELPDHDDVRVLHYEESIGQRAMQNRLAQMSNAKYVMKADAHTAWDEGFDIKMLDAFKEVGDDVTMVPVMKNLHAFDWVCDVCGLRTYQGPQPTECVAETCFNSPVTFHKEAVFKPRRGTPNSRSYLFNNQLQFWYFGAYERYQEGDLVETMSLQGSCFMASRERYFELPLCDETWGSWGQQGTEVALKTWLSGGRVVVNRRTWYAHMFRTQRDFSFPYPMSGRDQHKARQISRDIFLNDKWDKAVRPLSWLLEKFWRALQEEKSEKYINRWTQADLDRLKKTPTKGILYFTDNELPVKFARKVQSCIRDIANDKGYELVSSTRKPMHNMGKNIVTNEPRGYLTMFKQILKGLEAMESDVVFMAEHDVFYPPEHFDFTPTQHKFYYDQNWYKIHPDGLVTSWDADQVSGLCAFRQDLIDYYKHRVETFDADKFDRKFEPYSGIKSESWKAPVPHIDIRTGKNLTYNKRSLDDFRNKSTAVDFMTCTIDDIPGWDNLSELLNY